MTVWWSNIEPGWHPIVNSAQSMLVWVIIDKTQLAYWARSITSQFIG